MFKVMARSTLWEEEVVMSSEINRGSLAKQTKDHIINWKRWLVVMEWPFIYGTFHLWDSIACLAKVWTQKLHWQAQSVNWVSMITCCSNTSKLIHIRKRQTYQPHSGALKSSETPNDMDPMKSFLVVRSQSHTSIDSRRSLSVAFSLLNMHACTHTQTINHNEHFIMILYRVLTSKSTHQTHKVKDSFHVGLREERMVRVFCLVSFLGSGISLSFT